MRFALASFILCFLIYMLIGVLFLYPYSPAKNAPEPVVDERKSGSFCILLSCEETDDYAAFSVDYDQEQISLTLFDSKEKALFSGFDYDRRINYTRQSKIDLIGWLGGIVIDENICYNDDNCKLILGEERIFGVRADELSAECDNMRAAIAYKTVEALLRLAPDEEDFPFLFSLCDSDVSYADYCRHLPFIIRLSNRISVSMG